MAEKSTTPQWAKVFGVLKKCYPVHPFSEINGTDPYRILISCILTLRTQDAVALPITKKLFARARNLQEMAKLSVKQIQDLIYPVGFYRNKAKNIHDINQFLLQENDGNVPNTLETLLALKGVGRKTANLVLSLGFDRPAICVDVHVHRISNRLKWIVTSTPEETEFALMEIVPKRYWNLINQVLVLHGQNVCRPIKPKCFVCPIVDFCGFEEKTLAG